MRLVSIVSFILLGTIVAAGYYYYWIAPGTASTEQWDGDESSREFWRRGSIAPNDLRAVMDAQYDSMYSVLGKQEALLGQMENLTLDFTLDQAESREYNPYRNDQHGWHQWLELAKNVPCEDSQPHPEYWCDSFYSPEETSQVQEAIYNLQHPENCSNSPVLYLKSDGDSAHGLGTFVHVFSSGLAEAIERKRVLLNGVSWRFSSSGTCTRHSLDCLFWPVSHCVSSDDARASHIPVSRMDRVIDVSNLTVDSIQRYQASLRQRFPAPWQQQKQNELHWWRAQLTKYLLRPRPALIELSAMIQTQVFHKTYGHLPRPMISLHIRHGGFTSPLVPARSYVWEIERKKIREKYGAKSIFVTTDDPEVITELLAEWSSLYDIYYFDTARTNLDWNDMIRYIGADREAALAFAQLFIAVQADFFAGTRSSHWARLIDELRKANGKARTPYMTPVRDREAEW